VNTRIHFLHPVEKMTVLLADHYGKKAARYRRAARGYVDDRLREVFSPARGVRLRPASQLFRKLHSRLLERVVFLSKLSEREAAAILRKLEIRSDVMKLSYKPSQEEKRFMDLISLAVVMALDFDYTGRFTG
jgi:uncharacterized protein YceH (UPF0502 family)